MAALPHTPGPVVSVSQQQQQPMSPMTNTAPVPVEHQSVGAVPSQVVHQPIVTYANATSTSSEPTTMITESVTVDDTIVTAPTTTTTAPPPTIAPPPVIIPPGTTAVNPGTDTLDTTVNAAVTDATTVA